MPGNVIGQNNDGLSNGEELQPAIPAVLIDYAENVHESMSFWYDYSFWMGPLLRK